MIFNNIFTWDNFFTPLEYELAINEAYQSSFNVKDAAYMGFQAEHKMSDELANIIQEKIANKLNSFLYNHSNKPAFRLALKNDRTAVENPMHTDTKDPLWDRSTIAIIISLTDSPSSDEDLYMCFYENDLIGKHMYSPQFNYEKLMKLEWKEYSRIKYTKNRAIIFHPCLFHGTNNNHGYGDNIANGRITIHSFYRMCYNENIYGNDYKIGIKELS